MYSQILHLMGTPSSPLARQVQVSQGLRHPNVVRLIGYCDEHLPERNVIENILVFELVPGGNLHEFLKKGE